MNHAADGYRWPLVVMVMPMERAVKPQIEQQ
jgi:hypothetical protein